MTCRRLSLSFALNPPLSVPRHSAPPRAPNTNYTPNDNMRLHQCLLLLFALLSPLVQGAILAIDYGAEFTKLSLVKPGTPFDVLLDRDAKRKISSVVGWKKNDRVFGAEGKMSVSRAAS